MLERQQLQMVAGVQERYRRLRNYEAWPCSVLEDDLDPQPLTHRILETLGVLPEPWEETDHVSDALKTAPQSPFDVGLPNSLPEVSRRSPSYGANDGWTSTLECSPPYGANHRWMLTPDCSPAYGVNPAWISNSESDIVCTEPLQLAHMAHVSPITDDSQELSKRKKLNLNLRLSPPFMSFLTFGHPGNIPSTAGVMQAVRTGEH